MRLGAVDVLGAEVVDLAPRSFAVDQRAVEVGASSASRLASSVDIFSGSLRPWNGLICQASLPSQACTGGQALQARFGAHRFGRLLVLRLRQLELSAEDQLARAFSVLIAATFGATARLEILREQLVSRQRVREHRRERERQDATTERMRMSFSGA